MRGRVSNAPLTDGELTDLQMAASIGDFGTGGDDVDRAVEEIRGLRARVAELERLNEAAASANAALDQIAKHTVGLLVEVLDLYDAAECVGPTRGELDRVAEIRTMVQRDEQRPPSEWALAMQARRAERAAN